MLEFEEARARVLQHCEFVGRERIAVENALGRVLAEAVIAPEPVPRFDTSAMDGYAAHSQDFSGSGPWQLPVLGESKAGTPAGKLAPNSVGRIFTGALLPEGADCVVLQENVTRTGDTAPPAGIQRATVQLAAAPSAGDHVRRRGADIAAGAEVLSSGTRLLPPHLGLLASVERTQVLVSRRPCVGLLCTGSELRPAGSTSTPGSIPESNSVALAAWARQVGAVVRVAPLVVDDRDATTTLVREFAAGLDLLVTVGGVSVGDHDVVQDALIAAGAEIDFWKVRIKPGKPLLFGRLQKTLVLGLPGNPVSAQLTFALFGLPLLRGLQGENRALPTPRRSRLNAPIHKTPGRMTFARVCWSPDGGVVPLDNQSSGAPHSLAHADGLALIPADSAGFDAGESVDVLPLAEL